MSQAKSLMFQRMKNRNSGRCVGEFNFLTFPQSIGFFSFVRTERLSSVPVCAKLRSDNEKIFLN